MGGKLPIDKGVVLLAILVAVAEGYFYVFALQTYDG